MNRFSYQASFRRLLVTSIVASLGVTLIGCAATTLHDAAQANQSDQIVVLLNAGQNINGKDIYGYTPLHWAAYDGSLEAAEALVTHGANLEAVESSQMTPLMVAVYYKKINVAWYLLQKGAKVDARDTKGWTALYFAITNGNPRMVNMLLGKGASVNAATPDQPSPLMVAHQYHGDGPVFQLLVEHGARY